MPRFCREIRQLSVPPSKSLVIPQSYQPKRFSGIAGGECRGGSVLVTPIRLTTLVSVLVVAAGPICAAQPSSQVPLPPAKPAAIKSAPKAKATEHKAAEHKATDHKASAHIAPAAPLSLRPGAPRATASVPNPAGRG